MSARERGEIDGERRLLLLPAQRRLELRVAAVDEHAVAGDVGRREERQPHDVVPVHVRHEHVVSLRAAGRGAPAPPGRTAARRCRGRRSRTRARRSRSRRTTCGRRTCPPSANGERVDVALDLGLVAERAARRGAQRGDELAAHAVAVSATGIEPRVPQKRTRFTCLVAPARRRRRAPARNRADGVANVARHVDDVVEPADLEDLGDDRLQRRDRDRALRARSSFAATISTRRPTLLM